MELFLNEILKKMILFNWDGIISTILMISFANRTFGSIFSENLAKVEYFYFKHFNGFLFKQNVF